MKRFEMGDYVTAQFIHNSRRYEGRGVYVQRDPWWNLHIVELDHFGQKWVRDEEIHPLEPKL